MSDVDEPLAVTARQADAVRRAVGLMVTWHDADRSELAYALHREHLAQLLEEDGVEGQHGRLLHGLITLAGQLMSAGAELAGVDELVLLQAISESYSSTTII